MILAVSHFTAYRVAVHMHIQRAHKNRNLYAAISKIFIGLYFFNGHYFTIGRSDNSIFLNGKHSFGNPKKGNDEKQENQC